MRVSEPIEDALAAWTHEYRDEQIKNSRIAEGDARARAEDITTMEGLLTDYAKSNQAVMIQSTSGANYLGIVIAVSPNLVCLRVENMEVWLRSKAVVTMRAFGNANTIALSETIDDAPHSMLTVVAEAAYQNARARIYVAGIGEPIVADFVSCGEDTAVVRTNQMQNRDLAIRIAAISEVCLIK
jgi:hypothetical protein